MRFKLWSTRGYRYAHATFNAVMPPLRLDTMFQLAEARYQRHPHPAPTESELVKYKRRVRRKLKARFILAYASIAMTSMASGATSRRPSAFTSSYLMDSGEDGVASIRRQGSNRSESAPNRSHVLLLPVSQSHVRVYRRRG